MIPRLHIDAPLSAKASIALSREQAHYLKAVLRRNIGDEISVFNARDGEFCAEIKDLSKKGGIAQASEQTRESEETFDLALAFSPVKRNALEMIIQKATELGVGEFQPVQTAHTNSMKLNSERLAAIALEAAEQCERLSVPTITPVIKLEAFLEDLPTDRALVFCDEAGDEPDARWGGRGGRAPALLDALRDHAKALDQVTVLIGPEGGFTPAERRAIRAHDRAIAVTLGPRILRADTAAIAALTLIQAACGDWRKV